MVLLPHFLLYIVYKVLILLLFGILLLINSRMSVGSKALTAKVKEGI